MQTIPDLRRYTPIKNPRNVIEEEYNHMLRKLCVHIECFFSKLMTTSGVLHGVYQWSHTHFDDFTIGCCLVNERLSTSMLNQEDHWIFKGFLMQRIRKEEERQRRDQEHDQAYQMRKRVRLAGEPE